MAEDADRDLLRRVATEGKTPEGRAKAQAMYRELYGEDVHPAGPAGATAAAAEPEEPSLGRRMLNAVTPSSSNAFWGGVETLGERASNMLTMGASRGVMDLMDASRPQRRAQLEAEHPVSGFFGDLGGAVAGAVMGPARAVDTAVRGGAAKVLPWLAETPLGRLITGTASSVTENAAQNFAQDPGTLKERVLRMGDNIGTAAALGAGGGLLAEGAELGTKALQLEPWIKNYSEANRGSVPAPGPVRPNGEPGPPLRDVQGDIVNLPAKNRIQSPEVKATRDIQAGSDEALNRMVRRENELARRGRADLEAARAPYVDSVKIKRKGMHSDAEARMEANIGKDHLPKNRKMQGSLERFQGSLGSDMEKTSSLLDADGKPIVQQRPDPTYGDVIARRAAERRASGFKNPEPTEGNDDARLNYELLGEGIKRDVPKPALDAEGVAAANAKDRRRTRDSIFKTEGEVDRGGGPQAEAPAEPPATADDLLSLEDLPETEISQKLASLSASARKDALKNAEAGKPDLQVNKELAGSTMLSRIGDTDRPGLRNRKLIDDMIKRDPEGAGEIMQYLMDVKSREATGARLTSPVPSNFSKAMSLFGLIPMGEQATRFVGGRLIEPMLRRGAPGLRKTSRLVPLLRDPLDAFKESRRRQENDQ